MSVATARLRSAPSPLPAAIVLSAAGVLGGVVSFAELLAGHPWAPLVFGWLALGFLTWRFPSLGPVLTLACGVFVDEGALNLPDSWTDTIPLYTSLVSGAGIPGAYVTPMEVMFAILLLVAIARGVAMRQVAWPRSRVALPLGVLAFVILLAEVYGIAVRQGNLQVSVQELRSWFFLFGSFLLIALTARSRADVERLLWLVVLAIGFKGLQGTVRLLFVLEPAGRYPLPDQGSILGHEEAWTFGIYLALTAALWMYGVRGRLRTVATCLAPLVLVADLANQRRTAWFIAGAAVAVLLVVGIIRVPERRRALVIVAVSIVAVSAVYLPLEWKSTSGLTGQPARAIASIFSPSVRDASSNHYRVVENANLQFDIRSNVLLPAGFGVKVAKPIPMWDATKVDPFIDYVPHNQVLYIWYRLGSIGVVFFWWAIAVAMSTALGLARGGDRFRTVFGAVVACALVGWVLQGLFDQGLTSDRIAIVLGSLLGGVEWLAARPEVTP